MDISKQIISILKRLKSAKAREIAMELSKLSNRCFAKNVVNDILYNKINDIVEHDDHFYWSLKSNHKTINYNNAEVSTREEDDYKTKHISTESIDSKSHVSVNSISSIYSSDIVDNVISLNSENKLSVVGIARTLHRPTTVIYKILRESNLLNTNSKDTLWYKEVTIPAELRLQLKAEHITFGLWCSSLKISPIIFAKALEAKLSGLIVPNELDFAFTALIHDFPSVLETDEIAALNMEDAVGPEPPMALKTSSSDANNKIGDVVLNNALPALRTTEDSHLVSILSCILLSKGVLNVGSIIREVKTIHADTYSEHCIESELSQRYDFVRFAPNIYGLQEHLNGFGVSTSDLLLNDKDCQLYTMARYAGEELGSFPLWTASMEYKWYQWLDKKPNSELHESFRFIASPDVWPVNDKTAEELSYKISSQDNTYYFLSEPNYQSCSLPDIQSLLSLVRYVNERGSINWIAANRVLGRRLDDKKIVAHLALLVCLGIIYPAHNWQSSHKVVENNSEFDHTLYTLLRSDQYPAWSSRVGEFLLDTFTININTKQAGWVNVSTINKLFFSASSRAENINNNDDNKLAVSTHSANVVSAKASNPLLNHVTVKQLTEVLSSRFANGFRLNSPIELARFRLFVKNDVGYELSLSDEELKSRIAACGTVFDGKVYAVSAQTVERIKQLAEDYFANGAHVIFFAEFYAKNEKWLFEASVVSEDMLIEILRRLFSDWSFTQTYFGYTKTSIFAALESEILRVWGDDVLRSYSQLAESLMYIPIERIKYALSQNGDFIWNSVETFSHISKVIITEEEQQAVRDVALRECNSRGYASIVDLPLGDVFECNYRLSFAAVHNAVYRICLSDKFDLQGKIITRKGDTLDALTIMKNYCRSIDKCSLEDLLNYEKELTGEIHRWIPMEAGNSVLVRIDKDNYVADKFVHFDTDAVDTAIELFIENDYLPLISFTTFGSFPHCGQVWNLFLLESYCRRFSKKFRFDTPSVNSRNAGVIIRKSSGMDYTEVMTNAVSNADIPLTNDTVGRFLYENGFTGRSTSAKVSEIIEKIKSSRERTD